MTLVDSGLVVGSSASSVGAVSGSGDDSGRGGGADRDVRPGMIGSIMDGSSCGDSTGKGGKKTVRSSSTGRSGSSSGSGGCSSSVMQSIFATTQSTGNKQWSALSKPAILSIYAKKS